MQWNKVTLVGVGLLGGSLGLALREHRLAGSIHGFVRRESAVAECLNKGAVDAAGMDLEKAVDGADLVVLCTPLAQMRPLVERMLPVLKPGAMVTDVGSVKGSVVRDLEPLIQGRNAQFIGSHPMAGSEQTGIAKARLDLFHKAICVVTCNPSTPDDDIQLVAHLWDAVGGVPLLLTPAQHDELVCRSSHLPHVLAASLAHYVLDPELPKEQGRLCAGGFRDTTRVASGSPEMWRDICIANRENLSRLLGVFIHDMARFHELLDSGNEEALQTFFEEAKARRDLWRQPNDPSQSG